MKHILLLLLLYPIALQAQGPPPPEEETTAFRYSFFQANYRTQKILIRGLEQRQALLPANTKEVQIIAKDLYKGSGAKYTFNNRVEDWVQAKYAMTHSQKMAKKDGTRSVNR